ncbi:hypothetical protein [Aquiluna borgnonia]|nr:hypothetical protein [Aquiluna borgnonia]
MFYKVALCLLVSNQILLTPKLWGFCFSGAVENLGAWIIYPMVFR